MHFTERKLHYMNNALSCQFNSIPKQYFRVNMWKASLTTTRWNRDKGLKEGEKPHPSTLGRVSKGGGETCLASVKGVLSCFCLMSSSDLLWSGTNFKAVVERRVELGLTVTSDKVCNFLIPRFLVYKIKSLNQSTQVFLNLQMSLFQGDTGEFLAEPGV